MQYDEYHRPLSSVVPNRPLKKGVFQRPVCGTGMCRHFLWLQAIEMKEAGNRVFRFRGRKSPWRDFFNILLSALGQVGALSMRCVSSDTKNRLPTTSRIDPLFHSDKVVGWGWLPRFPPVAARSLGRPGRGAHTDREAGRSQRACRSFPSLPPRRESAGNGGRKRRFTLSDMQKFSSPYKGT